MKQSIFSHSLNYSIRDLIHRMKFTVLFIVNLAIGLFSFILVDSIRTSFDRYVNNNSKQIATADITIQSRRMMTQEEREAITDLYPNEQLAQVTRFFSMASNPKTKNVRLVRVNAVSDHFPLYGHLELTDMDGRDMEWEDALKIMKTSPVAMVTKEIQSLYLIEPGDSIKVGNRKYRVGFILERDVGDRLQVSALAYKIYIAEGQVESGLLQEKGTTARFHYYIKVPGVDNEALSGEIEKIYRVLDKAKSFNVNSVNASTNPDEGDSFQKSDLRVRSHNQNSSNIQRVITMVHRYFELITLVTLFLCGVGVFYLFRNFIFSKVKEIAILESLGMNKYRIILTLIVQLIILGVGGVGVAVLLFFIIKPLIPLAFGNFLPSGVEINLQLASLAATLVIAVLGSLLFTFPIVWAVREIKIITLIRQNLEPKKMLRMTLWSFFPNIIFFYALSVWMGKGFVLGSTFSGLFLGSIVIVFLIGGIFWKIFSVFKKSPSFTISFISRNLYKNRSKGFFYFFAIALSIALISLTPQLEYSINKEIESPDGTTLPSLFIFEVKRDDLNGLKQMAQESKGNLQFSSPMISSEIKTVNGNPFRQLNDDRDNQERSGRPRRNQVNLTYRNFLSDTESIIKGEPLATTYDGNVAEISIEERFADRNGLEIGDKIGFSLINVPFEFTGKVVNLRKVKWNSFQPNFFITVQDQVLNDVPQKFVTSVNRVDFDNKVNLVSKINANFPHISVIDVQEIIREILKLIARFSLLLKLMAGFCLILGLMILFTIINQEITNQEREINLLKAIGGKFSTLYTLVMGEYALVGFLAVLSGLIPGVILNYLLSVYFFDGAFAFSPRILLEIIIIVMPGILLVNYLGARKVLHGKPIVLLKEN